MKIVLLPLEPLEERYTAWWYKWFPREFERLGVDYVVIDGERLTQRVETGAFLDVHSSYYWELSQLKQVVKMFKCGEIKDGDVIFSMDIEFPGHFYALKYLALKSRKKVRTYGFLHAGSYTVGDFVSFLEPSMKYFEIGWLETLDGVFVASNYHRNAIINRRLTHFGRTGLSSKIHVTGNPFFLNDAYSLAKPKPPNERSIDVIITDRPDEEKRVWDALILGLSLSHRLGKKLNIALTTSRAMYLGWNSKWIRDFVKFMEKHNHVKVYEGLSKQQYYELLSNSRIYITATIEENFGYCSVEAMAFDVCPIMPNKFAFPEHVDNDSRFLYNSYDEAIEKAINLYLNPVRTSHYVKKYEKAIENMVKVMLSE
jgi:glycosyltransferase involved in cell wall biosynthesis